MSTKKVATRKGSIVYAAGVPLPTPARNEKAVKGGAIGGGLGALLGGVLLFTPLGIAVFAGIGAFAGAAIGAESDKSSSR